MSLVTIEIEEQIGGRTSNGVSDRSFSLGSFIVEGENGVMVERHFVDNMMSPTIALEISSDTIFDTEKEYDRENLSRLREFLSANADMASTIKIKDPIKEEEEIHEITKLSFDIEKHLRDQEGKQDALAKIYRRVVGETIGIRPAKVFNDLIEIARTDPHRFFYNGVLVYKDKSFETYALIDTLVERGLLSRTIDGMIKRADGHIFADSIEKAAYIIENNDDLRVNFKAQIDDKKEAATKYEPVIEDTGHVDSLTKVDIAAKKDDAEEQDSKKEILANITKFVDAGLLIRSGAGIATRYAFYDSPGNAMTKDQVYSHLVANTIRYKGLIQLLNK